MRSNCWWKINFSCVACPSIQPWRRRNPITTYRYSIWQRSVTWCKDNGLIQETARYIGRSILIGLLRTFGNSSVSHLPHATRYLFCNCQHTISVVRSLGTRLLYQPWRKDSTTMLVNWCASWYTSCTCVPLSGRPRRIRFHIRRSRNQWRSSSVRSWSNISSSTCSLWKRTAASSSNELAILAAGSTASTWRTRSNNWPGRLWRISWWRNADPRLRESLGGIHVSLSVLCFIRVINAIKCRASCFYFRAGICSWRPAGQIRSTTSKLDPEKNLKNWIINAWIVFFIFIICHLCQWCDIVTKKRYKFYIQLLSPTI